MRQSQINTPYKTPLKDQPAPYRVWFDHLEGIGQRRSPKRPYEARENDGLEVQGELGDLVDDSRPLTPPRRNRDMRDFFIRQDRHDDESLADLMESRNYPRERQDQSLGRTAEASSHAVMEDANEDHGQRNGILGGTGFVPASELTAIENRFGPQKPDTSRPAKRRKTNEVRVLREISGNAPAQDEANDEEYPANANAGAAPIRRRTTEGNPVNSRRRKSSRLPLERVPNGQATHNLRLDLPTDMRKVSDMTTKIDKHCSLLGWNEHALNSHNGFATTCDAAAMKDLTTKLQEVLTHYYPESEMVHDLGVMVHGAFAAHSQAMQGMDA